MTQKAKIFLIDDDKALCDLLQMYFTENLLDVIVGHCESDLIKLLENNQPDLIILDIMLPGTDGLSIAQKIRIENQVPLILISARGDEIDRILGLEIGADDYLPKPFNPRELLARIKALLRRSQYNHQSVTIHKENYYQNKKQTFSDSFQFGDFVVYPSINQLTYQGGKVSLSMTEFALLKIFIENPNHTISRDELIEKLKGYTRQPFDRSIDVRVTRLRKKLEPDPSNPVYIRTVWGQGYSFTPQGEM